MPSGRNTGKPQKRRPLKIGQSYDAAFSPDGTLLCVSGRSVSLWSVPDRKKLWRAHPLSHPADLVFTQDDQRIVVKNTSGLIVQADVGDGSVVEGFTTSVDGEGANMILAPAGDVLVDGSWNGAVTFRSCDDGEVLDVHTFEHQMVRSLHRTADGFYTHQNYRWPRAQHDHRLVRWSWNGTYEPVTWVEEAPQHFTGRKVAITPDGTACAIEDCEDRRVGVAVRSMDDGTLLWTSHEGESVFLQSLEWSHRGELLAATTGDRAVLRDAGTGALLAEWTIPYVASVVFSPDDRWLMIGSATSAGILVDLDELHDSMASSEMP